MGGSHSTSIETLANLACLLNVQVGDVIWDIGIGRPLLALYFSMLCCQPVVGTDIG
jgi:hypothetical protein